jgi:hypothetical protein
MSDQLEGKRSGVQFAITRPHFLYSAMLVSFIIL